MKLLPRFLQFGKRNVTQSHGVSQPGLQGQPSAKTPSSSIQPQPPKTLAELEKEIEVQYAPIRVSRVPKPIASVKKTVQKLMWLSLLWGIPVGAIWVINLPYPIIRRPIARMAPMLLLPSYMSTDENYRNAITSVEQASQLINQATSAADIELGEQKVNDAQASLDALPLWFLDDFPEYHFWWYSWRFSAVQFDAARAKIGTLKAKVFQEKNAQSTFVQTEHALTTAKQQYQQAQTAVDRQTAIDSWRSALNQLEQIPAVTFAGRAAQQQRMTEQRQFQETVGLAADDEQTAAVVASARQFAWQAAKLGQNPPHSVEEWQQIATLWQDAIDRLGNIPSDNIAGYTEAQQLMASYRSNLAQLRVRQQAEADSARALQSARQQVQDLQTAFPTGSGAADRNRMISQLQGIIAELKQVNNGTTSYSEAQKLLFFAERKLSALQP